MGLKKRAKVSAEFSMSSLTDIIFLLLIFFMLTSKMVNFDKFDLPESNAKTVASINIVVALEKDGKLSLNNKEMKSSSLKSAVRKLVNKSENRANATMTIVAEKGVPFSRVTEMMKIASQLKISAILATKPIKT